MCRSTETPVAEVARNCRPLQKNCSNPFCCWRWTAQVLGVGTEHAQFISKRRMSLVNFPEVLSSLISWTVIGYSKIVCRTIESTMAKVVQIFISTWKWSDVKALSKIMVDWGYFTVLKSSRIKSCSSAILKTKKASNIRIEEPSMSSDIPVFLGCLPSFTSEFHELSLQDWETDFKETLGKTGCLQGIFIFV